MWEVTDEALHVLNQKHVIDLVHVQVSECEKLCPETWCVVGNCFSLQRDHDAAIKFFERAVQVDSCPPLLALQLNSRSPTRSICLQIIYLLVFDYFFESWCQDRSPTYPLSSPCLLVTGRPELRLRLYTERSRVYAER